MPSPDPGPRDRRMLDGLLHVEAGTRRRRAHGIGSLGALAGLVIMWLAGQEALPAWLQLTCWIVGGGLFFSWLAWLSTTPFGKALAEFILRWKRH